MNKKRYIITLKEMSIFDKILLFLEIICYFLVLGDIAAVIFAINNNSDIGVILLLVAFVLIIKCTLETRESRELHIGIIKLKNSNISKLLKFN